MGQAIDGVTVHRLAAFTDDPRGGNPAGVVVTDRVLAPDRMLRIAAEVGYSETAFLLPDGDRRYRTRYFAPKAEVTFCGHATIAAGVLLGGMEGPGTYVMDTLAGAVPVEVAGSDAAFMATLTSVAPTVEAPSDALLAAALDAFRWSRADLAPAFPPAVAFAGARHLILVLADRDVLASMDYDFDALGGAMAAADLTTVALLWQRDGAHWDARNAFPTGGVVEDPATGAAAAAFGAYLRHHGMVEPPVDITIEQGVDMGRPSTLRVAIPPGDDGIAVSGTAVPIG